MGYNIQNCSKVLVYFRRHCCGGVTVCISGLTSAKPCLTSLKQRDRERELRVLLVVQSPIRLTLNPKKSNIPEQNLKKSFFCSIKDINLQNVVCKCDLCNCLT